jgi:hypothetical protein
MSKTTTRPQATKKFKALVAYLGSEDRAVTAWNKSYPDNKIPAKAKAEQPSTEVQALVDAGFSLAEAQEFVGEKAAPAEPTTSRELGEALVTDSGLVPVRGRVYGDGKVLEACARVLKNGKPEIVRNAGETRTKGVLVYRTDDGKNFAVQNLGQPA